MRGLPVLSREDNEVSRSSSEARPDISEAGECSVPAGGPLHLGGQGRSYESRPGEVEQSCEQILADNDNYEHYQGHLRDHQDHRAQGECTTVPADLVLPQRSQGRRDGHR